MNINQKIEEIRRQPEHIRMRWVWGAVTVSMFFIFMLWLFSLQVMFQQETDTSGSDAQNFGEALDKIKETAPSLKDVPLSGRTTDTSSEGIGSPEINN